VHTWTWQGHEGGHADRTTLTYAIEPADYQYLTNCGVFAFAIDPDCSFYASDVVFTVLTAPTLQSPHPRFPSRRRLCPWAPG